MVRAAAAHGKSGAQTSPPHMRHGRGERREATECRHLFFLAALRDHDRDHRKSTDATMRQTTVTIRESTDRPPIAMYAG